ncbi:hypothetical protein LCGC14_2919620 [marine sediment metagenome]|uniref:RNA polymerase sigma-70 region 2 domain-containing protein n=1 Tax=marine sediment metagenome TaxID=412755 RepID=A0A0F8XPD1_9ZZZZ
MPMDRMLQECLEGQKRAWDSFVDRYAPVIFAAVGRALRAHGGGRPYLSAEDAAQDVFVRLIKDDLRLLRTYDPARSSLPTWLTIVARSTTIDSLRRRRLRTVPLDDAPPLVAPPEAPPASLPTGELPADILTPRQRLVLTLIYDREMAVPAAAAMLGVSEQTVRSTKHKAIQRLRQYYGEDDSS